MSVQTTQLSLNAKMPGIHGEKSGGEMITEMLKTPDGNQYAVPDQQSKNTRVGRDSQSGGGWRHSDRPSEDSKAAVSI